jgi:hypothetical protein
MYELALSTAEQHLLREILETQLRQLSVESLRTDGSEFRERLRERSATIEAILDKLPNLEVVP